VTIATSCGRNTDEKSGNESPGKSNESTSHNSSGQQASSEIRQPSGRDVHSSNGGSSSGVGWSSRGDGWSSSGVEMTDRDAFLKDLEPSQEDLKAILIEFQTGQRSFDFYAVFTEPFWTVYFFGHHALFTAMDWEYPQLLPLEYPFNPDTYEEQTLRFALSGELWELRVKREEGSDGMSEISYPYSVEYDMIKGGGATKLMLGQ